jgi:methionyl-tRNA synthetase
MTSRANLFIQQSAPWTVAKDPARGAELDAILAALVRSLARQAVLLAAIMPGKAAALWAQLGAPAAPGDVAYAALGTLSAEGWRVSKGDALFPRPEPPKSPAGQQD